MNEETPDRPESDRRLVPPGLEMSLPSEHDLTETHVHVMVDDAPGDTPPLPLVGRYQCDRKLNHTGMANVYEAHDTKLPERRAIVKIVKAEPGRPLSESTRDGLLYEARKTVLASEANQDYFALVYDLGYDAVADWAWFAMQKLSGETLREKLNARKQMVPSGTGMDVQTACWLTIEILKALQILHNIGMLHGDVKPANVMWTTEGKVKLLDLGLAKFLHLFNESAAVNGGTLRYLAPEFYEANEQDIRIDLFAVGIVLYELLTGDLPEALGRSVMETRDAHQQGCIPASAQEAEIPEFCKKIIAKAADPDPGLRYQNAGDFLHALEKGLKVSGGLIGGKPKRRLVRLTIGLLATLCLGIAFWSSRPKPPPPIDYQGECDVYVTERGGVRQDPRPVLGGAIDFLRNDDMVYLTAKLIDKQTGYLYVLQINSRGQARAIFPEGWAPDHLPTTESARTELRFPEAGEQPMDREEPPGLEALIWFVRPEPLTTKDNALVWDTCTGKGFAWVQPAEFDKVFVSFLNGEPTVHRGFDLTRTVEGQDPVSQAERIQLMLKNKGVAAYSRGMCYPLVAAPASGRKSGKDRR